MDVCSLEAFVTDKDTSGTNVREKPKINSSVIQVLPHSQFRAVSINKVHNGWLWISKSIDHMAAMSSTASVGDKTWKPVNGWIHSDLVALNLTGREYSLKKEPNDLSETIVEIPYTGIEKIIHIMDCKDKWIKTEIIFKGKRFMGWVPPAVLCDNPLTTCS